MDVITGGSPCQDLSIAGRREGLAGERSGLFLEQIRIIREMREEDRRRGRPDEFVRPRYAVWENVPNAFSTNKGKDFQTVLTEFVRVAEPDAPAVPLPEKGKWPRAGCVYDDMGGGAWPGASTTLSSGVCRSDENGLLWLRTSEDSQPRRYCLTLNTGEKPREPNPTKLSQVLERETDPKYRLSPTACLGILNRAERRGKELPKELKEALMEQISQERLTQTTAKGPESGGGAEREVVIERSAISFQERAGKPGGGKGILIQGERTGALSTINNQPVLGLRESVGRAVSEDIHR